MKNKDLRGQELVRKLVFLKVKHNQIAEYVGCHRNSVRGWLRGWWGCREGQVDKLKAMVLREYAKRGMKLSEGELLLICEK